MALMNRHLSPGLETVFMVPSLDTTYISSSLVREVAQLRRRRRGTWCIRRRRGAAREDSASTRNRGLSRFIESDSRAGRRRPRRRAIAFPGVARRAVIARGGRARLQSAASSSRCWFSIATRRDRRMHAGALADRRARQIAVPMHARRSSSRTAWSRPAPFDGCVAGAVHTTADVLRAALWLVGARRRREDRLERLLHGDVAPVGGGERGADLHRLRGRPYPTAQQLADIAIAAADDRGASWATSRASRCFRSARAAAARAERRSRARGARDSSGQKRPELAVDGELQGMRR